MSSSLLVTELRAQNLPTGGSVAAGSVSMASPSATRLNITQSSQSAVVNWQSFSIGQGYAVNIQQPNSSAAMLGRVTGSTPSTIAGTLTANGQFYLVNPNGIAITKGGVVNTGGFVASTLGISDGDFAAGRRTFTGNGASARVSNAGTITVGRGGYAALIGGTVSNSGNINVPMGKVGLGSGERITLDFAGDGFLQVAVPTTASSNGALIDSSGKIKANGGNVIISAATAREAARNAVNISGVVQARTIGGRSGAIVIGGGLGGGVKISGRLNAASRKGKGGAITVTGQDITLANAAIDASGKTGGGNIHIGGGRQGSGPLQHADTVSVDQGTVINADAIGSGKGGNVVVWSDLSTIFAGTISAKGGAQFGNGGEAEVSSHGFLDYVGFTNLSAARGKFGTLLLDPYDVVISSAADSNGSFDGQAPTSAFTPTGTSVINVTTLEGQLTAANVTISTGAAGSTGGNAGNITVTNAFSWGSSSLLTMSAANAIAINANIGITGAGQLALNATPQSGTTTTGITFGNGASVSFTGTPNTGQGFSLNGNSYTLVYSMSQLDAIDGVNAVNGNLLGTYGVGLSGNYALASNLNAGGTVYTLALVGTNSSHSSATQFAGQLDGLGHTIAGLTINAGPTNYVGLVGYSTGTISNIGLVGGSLTSSGISTGALVAENLGTVQNSFSTGAVSGGIEVGGLVSINYGTLQNSSATGSVVGTSIVGGLAAGNSGTLLNSFANVAVTGTSNVGGLVAENSGTVKNSSATGAVTGTSNVGGLIGSNGNMVLNSYATGAVMGLDQVGGLVGYNGGSATLKNSYASGLAAGAGGSSAIGGLVGENDGTVQASHATGNVSGTFGVGGLIGLSNGTVENSYATGVVNGTSSFTGGLIGGGSGTVDTSYATGSVTGAGNGTGGLIGNYYSGTVQNSYATGSVTGSGDDTGGLVGYSGGAVQTSHATGNVSGQYYVGGLIGQGTGTVQTSYATGSVTGVNTTGGLIGQSIGTVQNSYATGSVSGGQNTGGLLGYSYGTVQNNHATGSVTGTSADTGGLIGSSSGIVRDSYATGLVAGPSNVGGLVGFNGGQITNSYATGGVTGPVAIPLSAGGISVGGLAGFNSGLVSNSRASGTVSGNNTVGGLVGANYGGTVAESSATGTVNGIVYVGGLVGGNNGGGTISQSYATGTTTGAFYVGGLAGENSHGSTIAQSYAVGSVVGTDNPQASIAAGTPGGIGGLVGVNYDSSISTSYATGTVSGPSTSTLGGLVGWNLSGTISQTYAAGNVSGASVKGGLVGYNDAAGSVSQSFWDKDTTAQSNGFGLNFGSFSALGLANAVSYTQSSYTGWDFSNTGAWFLIDGQTRPFLRSEYSTNIRNAHQLQLIALDLGANYTLANNIDLGPAFVADANGTYSGMWGFSGFAPIGNFSTPFSGQFSGQGHTISNIRINGPTDYATHDTLGTVGLFGRLTGTVDQIGLIGGSVTGFYAGALVGINRSGHIARSYVDGTIVAGAWVAGGLVGLNYSDITNSYSTAIVTGPTAGGLVGANASLFTDLYNPMTFGTITTSYAAGTVAGIGNVGGLVGDNGGGWLHYSSGGNQFYECCSSQYPGAAVIQNSYSTSPGGLVGINNGLIIQSSVLTPTQLSSALPPGFDNSVWKIIIGATYPYFDRQPNTIPAVQIPPLSPPALGVGPDIVTSTITVTNFTPTANATFTPAFPFFQGYARGEFTNNFGSGSVVFWSDPRFGP